MGLQSGPGRARTLMPGAVSALDVCYEQGQSRMTYAPKIVLHCPHGYVPRLDSLVEQFLADRVQFVGVVGEDCARIEDIIDELVVGDGSDPLRFILTSSHPGESVQDVIEFASSLSPLEEDAVQVVLLTE